MDIKMRPWGGYAVLFECDDYVVKRLVVSPGQQTSLQSHEGREEDWIVAKGTATVVLTWDEDTQTRTFHGVGEHIHVPQGKIHRIANDTDEDVHLVEVWRGERLEEDDIKRYEDQYGRA